jgi:hypothetical protein
MDDQARARIEEALKGRQAGRRTSDGKGKPLVAVTAADLLACCEEAGESPVAQALKQGVAGARPDKTVYVQADDLMKLVEPREE